ncbi:MAG: hypothetical protein ACLPX7_24195 [Xanthobacteraceae bacterium]
MPARRISSLVWIGSALALGLVLGACTPGGQFDPTEVLSSDVFTTKKKLAGEREPLFPNGVPGAETGMPPDLVKGYQPPPEQQAADTAEAVPAPTRAATPAAAKPKPKPKPKPAIARAPSSSPAAAANGHDPAWDRAPTPSAAQAAQPAWPNSQQTAPAQTNWPAPGQPTAQPAPPAWPAAPPPAGQGQQTAQPAQPNWPNPSAPGTYSR